MNRTGVLFLVLLAIAAVLSYFAFQDPQRAQQLDQMRREIAFTGQGRDFAVIVLLVGIGGFVAYLLFTRR